MSIELTIWDLDIEASESCDYDSLSISLGPNATNNLAKLCSKQENRTITGNGHKLYIRFEADASHSGRGFNASYRAISSSK